MSSAFQRPRRSAGFSLVEVLVALAVAAMMTGILVKFVAGTRSNSARVGEALDMATMAETLLARTLSNHALQPGRTTGRTGPFRWRIEVQPTPFTAVARKMHTPAGAGTTKPEPDKSSRESIATPWVAYRIAVAIEAPSGRKHVADTVKIGPPAVAPR